MIASLPQAAPETPTSLIYPDSDGKPMSDNTLQYEWIVLLKENLEVLFEAEPEVFVAGDLLWYPMQGHPEIRRAPDVMVILGRSKGYRGSYKQWEEGDIAPQVVFEVLSPSNTRAEMSNKLVFYHEYGVEEYYSYDPEVNDLRGWVRREGILEELDSLQDWVSPRLGIRFDPQGDAPVSGPSGGQGEGQAKTLRVYFPNGDRFLSTLEREQLRQQERQRADLAEQRADRLAAKLRELGLDPDSLDLTP